MTRLTIHAAPPTDAQLKYLDVYMDHSGILITFGN